MIKHPISMKTLYILSFLMILFGVAYDADAQKFINGDLDGTVNAISDLPPNWENVPHTDPLCKADEDFEATPDLTNEKGFSAVPGIRGNPYSGKSFIAGLDFGPKEHHEGIQQKVSGFKVGNTYTITFYQCVVKQENAQDTSGSWTVYADKKLIGLTAPSSSQHDWNSPDVSWEKRTVTFKATKKSYMIKFLPEDDDDFYHEDGDSQNGSLRMGIDMISMTPGEPEVIVEIIPVDTVKVEPDPIIEIKEDLLAKQIDTTKLEVVKIIIDPIEEDTVIFKEPVEVIFQRPGKLNFKIVPEIDLSVYPNPSSGIFRIVTDQDEFDLTITDMAGRIIYKEEKCTVDKQVHLKRKGHFLIIVRADDNRAVKKLVIQ